MKRSLKRRNGTMTYTIAGCSLNNACCAVPSETIARLCLLQPGSASIPKIRTWRTIMITCFAAILGLLCTGNLGLSPSPFGAVEQTCWNVTSYRIAVQYGIAAFGTGSLFPFHALRRAVFKPLPSFDDAGVGTLSCAVVPPGIWFAGWHHQRQTFSGLRWSRIKRAAAVRMDLGQTFVSAGWQLNSLQLARIHHCCAPGVASREISSRHQLVTSISLTPNSSFQFL